MNETSTECKRCNDERRNVRGNLLAQVAHAQLVLTSLAYDMEGDDRVFHASDNVLDFASALQIIAQELDA
tara:strand:+ start:354 stop:563 length:210 start_codon:yes stop_codon:yes gene_type:complete